MNKILVTFFTFSLALLIAGCEEDVNYDQEMAREERYFNLYMDSRYPGIEPTPGGLYFISYEQGEGASPDTGDYVLINYLKYTIPDEKVVDTYTEEWAIDYNLYNSSVLYGPYKYRHGTEITGLREGLSMMQEGGIARLIFKSDLGHGSEGFENVGAFASLMYDVELVKVIDDPVQYERDQIAAFVAQNPKAYPVTDKESGHTLYYIPGVAGDSAQVSEGDAVEIYYTGRLLDGREFDSNEGNSSGFELTVGEGDVIKGWDIGLKWFRYGGTGQLLIPHELAYGEEGSLVGNTSKTAIPPYEALLFDIEVTKNVPEID